MSGRLSERRGKIAKGGNVNYATIWGCALGNGRGFGFILSLDLAFCRNLTIWRCSHVSLHHIPEYHLQGSNIYRRCKLPPHPNSQEMQTTLSSKLTIKPINAFLPGCSIYRRCKLPSHPNSPLNLSMHSCLAAPFTGDANYPLIQTHH